MPVLCVPYRAMLAILALTAVLAACGGGGGGSDGGGSGTSGQGTGVVSGVVTVAPGNVADADPAGAQGGSGAVVNMPNPALVGGFVAAESSAGCEPAGRSGRQAGVDRRDRYRVVLAADQVVQLTVADRISNESFVRAGEVGAADCSAVGMELGVERQGGGTRRVAVEPDSRTRSVTLVAREDGVHTLTVSATRGFSGYTLSVGSGGAGLSSAAAEFVPGELLVRFRGAGAAALANATPGLRRERGAAGGPQLMRVEQRAVAPAGVPTAAWAAASERSRTLMMAAALRRREDIAYAVPNYVWRTQAAPNDARFGEQWALSSAAGGIDWLAVWDARGNRPRSGGQGVTVAVIDNGIYYEADGSTHPDLRGQLDGGDPSDNGPPGVDFVGDPNRVGDADDNPRDAPPGIYHGTHVAGIVAAKANNGIGVSGVAWNAKVLPLKALNGGSGTLADVIDAMRYAAGLSTSRGPSRRQPVDVVNLSLGGAFGCEAFVEEVAAVRRQGVIVVSAAGNAGSDEPFCPASAEGVVGVGAIARNGRVAGYSNRGANVDVVAPGGGDGSAGTPDGVLGLHVDASLNGSGYREVPSYAFFNGTSFAAPHVSGVAALMRAAAAGNGGLTPEDFDCALAAGEITVSSPGQPVPDYGRGRISARRALRFAARSGARVRQPVVVATPSGLTFGTGERRHELELAVACSEGAQLVSVEVSGPFEVSGFGVGRETQVVVTARRGRVGNRQVARGTLVVRTDAGGTGREGRREIPLRLIRDDRSVRSSAGRQTIFLADPLQWLSGGSVTPVVLTTEQPQAGRYRYRFEGVPAGRYFALASSDVDNDGFICDAPEACSGWPSRDDLQTFRVEPGGRREIDFSVGYQSPALIQSQRELQRE